MNLASTARLLLACLAALGGAAAARAQTPAATTAPTPAAMVAQSYDALFNEMYRRPGDLDTAFRFAEQAAARGDYEAAIGALERMLFFNSNLPRVKLELGVCYFKLGSYDMARTYFLDALKGGEVPEDVRAQVRAYLAEIDRRLSRHDVAVFLHGGMRYQTNANIGPNDLMVRALGQDAILDNRFGKTPDWNTFQTMAASYAYKLNMRGDQIEATLLALNSRQFRLHQYDLALAELIVGHRIAIGQDASVKVYGIGDQVLLGDSKYFDALGGGVSARGRLGTVGIAEGYVEQRRRNFFGSFNFPTANDQTGDLTSAAITTDLRFGWLHWTTRLGYDVNRAVAAYNSYDRWSVDIAVPFEFVLPVFGVPRQFVIAPTAGYSRAGYKAPNVIIDPFVTRDDREWRVGTIFDAQIDGPLGIRTQVQYSKISSSLPNYRTSNFSVGFGPTLRF